MRHYELVFLVHPDQSEQVPAMIERYRSIIETDGGKGGATIIKNNTMEGNRTDLAGKGDDDMPGCSSFTGATTDGGGNTLFPPATGGFGVCTPGTGDEGPP